MKALLLAAPLLLLACSGPAVAPLALVGEASGAAQVDSQPKPSKVVPLSGNATAKGSAR